MPLNIIPINVAAEIIDRMVITEQPRLIEFLDSIGHDWLSASLAWGGPALRGAQTHPESVTVAVVCTILKLAREWMEGDRDTTISRECITEALDEEMAESIAAALGDALRGDIPSSTGHAAVGGVSLGREHNR